MSSAPPGQGPTTAPALAVCLLNFRVVGFRALAASRMAQAESKRFPGTRPRSPLLIFKQGS